MQQYIISLGSDSLLSWCAMILHLLSLPEFGTQYVIGGKRQALHEMHRDKLLKICSKHKIIILACLACTEFSVLCLFPSVSSHSIWSVHDVYVIAEI